LGVKRSSRLYTFSFKISAFATRISHANKCSNSSRVTLLSLSISISSRGLRAQFGVFDRVNIPEKKVFLSPCQTNPMPKVRDAVSEAPGRFNLDAQSAIIFWGQTA
jgi:hypothetical protein